MFTTVWALWLQQSMAPNLSLIHNTSTATAIPFIYSFSGNSAASAPISAFMCLWAIYIFPGSVYIFPPADHADPLWEYIIRSQTRECGNWDWGPDIPFLGTFVSNFRHFVFAVRSQNHYFVAHFLYSLLHRKKMFRCFPFPSRDVTLSRREYVSLIKLEVFPFPSWDSHRILLDQLVFLFTDRSFPGYSSSPGGNSSKDFDNSFAYLSPTWTFPVFSPFGQSSLIYMNCVWVNYIHI